FFINFLKKRRQLDLTVIMSTKVIKKPLLSSSERWFKYKVLTGTLEVREEFFSGHRDSEICQDNRDNFLFDCYKLQEVYTTTTGEITRLQYDFYKPTPVKWRPSSMESSPRPSKIYTPNEASMTTTFLAFPIL
ncbi:Hypothetical protein FKW44_002956, partial [Caligus rogercresseyi]